MIEKSLSHTELPNFITLLEEKFPNCRWLSHLAYYENIVFSLIVAGIICLAVFEVTRKKRGSPGRLQIALEIFVGAVDDFLSGILGPKARSYTPFIGTLFIYILSMNLFGLIPFMKSATSSWSTTLALALCVFVYVQYAAFKELRFRGYIDHLLGRPRGFLAFSVIFPLMMFFLHILSELVRPISLSLRLRSNIWGDDMLIAVISGLGLKAVPLLLFSTLLVIIASIVQAGVFCLLTTIYFTLIIEHEES
ncbi:MAG: F0F1 ATP synthase subunit A [Candidatus Omnitrophica bacterium]|nr:F0F1 ATP synthase subunit A [Candidatus Omnitrophota bacterium]